VGLPVSEDIMTFFRFDTIPVCDGRTDRQMDTLLLQRPALA